MGILEIFGLILIMLAFLVMFLVIWGLLTGRSEMVNLIDFLNDLVSRIYPVME